MPKTRDRDVAIVYVRDVPRDLAQKLKAAAALSGKSLQFYLLELLQAHVGELEKKGALPKGK